MPTPLRRHDPAGPAGSRPPRPAALRLGARSAAVTTLVLLAGTTGATAVPAYAAPVPDYELPFACGQEWFGSTRSTHSPNSNAVDFNRDGDLGTVTVSSAPGVVSRVADLGGSSYGRYLIVDHRSGASTLFAHLQSTWVATGQRVDQGDIVGLVGESGAVSGAHLHFEERVDGTVVAPRFHQEAYRMPQTSASRNCSDVPVVGDWDADGTSDLGVFRRSASARFRLADDAGARPRVVRYQRGIDRPVTGDWNGDGTTDVGVRRPGRKAFLLRRPGGSTTEITFGRVVDLPVTGDWDGDGTTEVGVWSPSRGRFSLRLRSGTVRRAGLGGVDDLPVTGDWDGNGTTDLAVYDADAGRFTQRWTRSGGTTVTRTVDLGTVTDLPVAGDWNGDGVDDLGVWRPATATYTLRTTPARVTGTARLHTARFGRPR